MKSTAHDLRQGQESSKKLYRCVSEVARQLDETRHGARAPSHLFTPALLILRSRFRSYCERLIFTEPSLYGRRCEELLWRKTYYDVIATIKRLKGKEYTPEETSAIASHLNAGIGHYHHFISRLQTEFNLNLLNFIDFPLLTPRGLCNESIEWSKQAVHRSLVYLGDLNRYKLEIYPNLDCNLALRYYWQACHFLPDYGTPHNQMGFIAASGGRLLDAAFHYMRSLSCKQPFEGTENNLLHLFENNRVIYEMFPPDDQHADCIIVLKPVERFKRLISRFLFLAEIWYMNKKNEDIYAICHQTSVDLRDLCTPSDSNVEIESNESDSIQTHLTDDSIFKLISICLMCMMRGKEISTIVAFTLAVYSQLIQTVLDHIYENLANLPFENGVKKTKVRRRRKKANSESDLSDPEVFDETFDAVSDVEICTSSEGDSDEELPNTEKVNGFDSSKQFPEEMLIKSRKIDVKDLLEIISEEKYLSSIKILSDWLICDVDCLKSCGKTMKLLLKQLINLLNIINIQFDLEEGEQIALIEDLHLRDLKLIAHAQKNLDFNYILRGKLGGHTETKLRIKRLISFGMTLTKVTETGISYDKDKRLFVIQEETEDVTETIAETEEENNKSGLKNLHKMKHMGQLWLAEEVRTLESRVKGRTSLSPYLVVDVEALTQFTSIVKHLVNSKKFILVVPSIVVSALDDLKVQKSEARDAIRWLEAQFHRGNRFCRAQRPQERATLPLIKYPKKRDKNLFAFIQIAECCHYLAQQQKGLNLVTLLIGDETKLGNESREVSYMGWTKSVGVNMELITEFYEKWRKHSKNKR